MCDEQTSAADDEPQFRQFEDESAICATEIIF